MKQLLETIDEHPGAAILLIIFSVIIFVAIYNIIQMTMYGPDKCVCEDDDEYED